jgi:hypothetical protein
MKRITGTGWAAAGIGAVLVLFAGQAAWGTTISMGLRLQDTNGNDLPLVGGAYHLQVGEVVQVVLSAQVLDPNYTGNTRPAVATRNKPLGLGNVYTWLYTTLADVFAPVIGDTYIDYSDGHTISTWVGYADRTAAGAGYPFVNVLNNGQTVAGAGASISPQTWTTFDNLNIAQFELGLGVPAAGTTLTGLPDDICSGYYIAVGPGTADLTTTSDPVGNIVLVDFNDGKNTIRGDSPLAPTEAVITIRVGDGSAAVPEPLTAALSGLGLAGMALVALRRGAKNRVQISERRFQI